MPTFLWNLLQGNRLVHFLKKIGHSVSLLAMFVKNFQIHNKKDLETVAKMIFALVTYGIFVAPQSHHWNDIKPVCNAVILAQQWLDNSRRHYKLLVWKWPLSTVDRRRTNQSVLDETKTDCSLDAVISKAGSQHALGMWYEWMMNQKKIQ